MKRTFQVMGLAIVMVMICVAGAYAAEQALAPDQAIDYSKKAEFASRVIALGLDKKDAVFVLAGVKLLDEIPVAVDKPGQTGKGAPAYDRDALLEQAKTFAGSNKNLLELIADAKAEKRKGYYISTCYYQYVCYWYGCLYEYVCY